MKVLQANERASVRQLCKWLIISAVIGILTGSASALFLLSLEAVTSIREANPYLLYFLPIGGMTVSYLYWKYGGSCAKGNNLILEQIQGGHERIPKRLAPFVLFGTLVTHVLGGSAGREGTAVQMSGSLSDWVGRGFRLSGKERKIALMCGISGGFGSVFGTPLAGAIFGMEVVAIGALHLEGLFPCFIASYIGDYAATAIWGVHRSHYAAFFPGVALPTILKVAFAAVLFGLASRGFSSLTHGIKRISARWIAHPVLRCGIGGTVIVLVTLALGTTAYQGLSLPLAHQSFEGEVAPLSFFWKAFMTALTLGTGFQGGEVTPLFIIGATLGNTLSAWLHVDMTFLAALGFIGVFCGAANTPIACMFLAFEIFGTSGSFYIVLTCLISYLVSGHSGIYTSQQVSLPKGAQSARRRAVSLTRFQQLKRRAHKMKHRSSSGQ